MEILGIGPLEVLLVIILALVILGPQDMVLTARKLGAWIRKIVRSPMWREIMETSREIREIPTTLIRDSGIEEAVAELKDTSAVVRSELNEATQAISAEVQQANQDLTSEVQQASSELAGEVETAAAETIAAETTAAETAAVETPTAETTAAEVQVTGMPPVSAESWPAPQPLVEQPPVEHPAEPAWTEESGNQPHPPLSPEYPRTIPLGVAEPPEVLEAYTAPSDPPEAAPDPKPEL